MESCGPGYEINSPTIAAVDDCLVIEPHCQLLWICYCLPDDFAGIRKPPLVLQCRIVAFDYHFSFLGAHFFFTSYFSSLAHFLFAPFFSDRCCSSQSSLSDQNTLYFAIHVSSSARHFGWRG